MIGQLSNQELLCPVCRKPIVPFKEMRLETLDEHIFDPNGTPSLKWGYWCPDESCATRVFGIFWNDEGDLYAQACAPYLTREKKASIPFIDGNDAPFGSFQRKCNVDVYKKDQNRTIIVLPKFMPGILSGMKIRTKWSYQGDYDGKVTKRRLGFEYITKGGVIHLWGLRMVKHCVSRSFRAWWELRKNPNATWHRNELKETIKQGTWPRAEWWRKVSAWVATILLRFSPAEIKNPLTKQPDYSSLT